MKCGKKDINRRCVHNVQILHTWDEDKTMKSDMNLISTRIRASKGVLIKSKIY